MKRWRPWLVGVAAVIALWQAAAAYGRWKHVIRVVFPDGSPAANAELSIWVDGNSLPINHGGGWLSSPPIWPSAADDAGVYRLNRHRTSDPAGIYIVAEAWKDGRRFAAWARKDSAKTAGWPLRMVLHPVP